MTSNTLAMIQAYLDGGSGSTMEQIIMKQAYGDIVRLTAERDAAWLKIGRIQNEIDCRVQHGAESNGHLEAILAVFKQESKW